MKKVVKQTIALVVILAFMITSHSGVIIINAQQQQREWTIKQNGYEVNFEIVSQWDGHFNGKVIITSTSNKVIHNWNIIFQSNFRIENIWNAKIESESEEFYFINNAEWNQDIEVGESREFGFTASYNGKIKCPTKIRMVSCLSEVKDDDYEVSYKVISDWESGFTGEIKVKNLSQESIEDWVLEFQSKSDIEDFWSAEVKEKSNGFYCIQNKGFNANIKSGDSLTIGIKGTSPNGENILSDICLKQVSYKNFFMADNDKDALTNEEELGMGTDLDNPDSDSDGIPDGYEVYELETSPCLIDTDGNGISDSEEDFDNDKLNNLDEYLNDTDAFEKDTDEDGLSDADEIRKTKTDPLCKDTDGDGLLDGDEVELGYSPLKKDTNNNGILDPDEYSYQTLYEEINDEEKKEVYKVSVSLNTKNNIKNVVQIDNIYNVDMLSSELEGLVGVPIEVLSSVDFDEAKIRFFYDESKLENVDEKNLGVLWYDEKNNWFELQEHVEIDTEKNFVTLTTTHFSKYMLVDSKKWFQVWSEELDYRGDYEYYDFAYAIDISRSMEKDSRLTTAKKALNSFVREQCTKDNGALIFFGESAKVVKKLGSSKESITKAINDLAISENKGNSIDDALNKSITQVSNGKNKNKIIILVSDGKISCNDDIIESANKKAIQIFAVHVGNKSDSKALKKYATQTKGEYYYCPTTKEIETVFASIQKKSLDKIDESDKDKDGVYDIYERIGVRLPNGKLIKTNPNKKDTDNDGLTDGEEIGWTYTENDNMLVTAYKIIGINKKIKVKFCLLYSNPIKKDTDGDKINDAKDPYPWHGYCGGKHPESTNVHSCNLNSSGYYECKKCGYKFKAPELEDANILTNTDKIKMASLLKLYAYYGIKNFRVNKTTNFCKNQKLLCNEIRKIRRNEKYKNKYAYSDANGLCKQKKYITDGKVYIRTKNINNFDVLFYSGAVADSLGLLSSVICPEFSLAWSLIATGMKEGTTIEEAKVTAEEAASMSLDRLSKEATGGDKYLYKACSNILKAESAVSIINDLIQSKVKCGDIEITVTIDRVKGGSKKGNIQQSWATFVYRGISPIYSDMGANYGGNDIAL